MTPHQHILHKLYIIIAIVAVAMLFSALPVKAGPLIVANTPDPNCIQQGARVSDIPFAVDPAKITGVILSPYPGDLTRWVVEAGRVDRVGNYCDPDGDPATVEYISGPDSVQLQYGPVNQTWTLVGELPPGIWYVTVRAVDQPKRKWCYGCGSDVVSDATVCPTCGGGSFHLYMPKEQMATVVFRAVKRDNNGPALR